jgi:hypothetical protein
LAVDPAVDEEEAACVEGTKLGDGAGTDVPMKPAAAEEEEGGGW